MDYFNDSNLLLNEMEQLGKHSCTVIDEANGCVAGCKAGFTVYAESEYNKGGVHDDQEGFLVLEGNGTARFGDSEFDIYPGLCMIAPAGVKHQIRKNKDSIPVKVFWFHSSINN